MVGFGAEKVPGKNVILVTAIANPEPLETYLKQAGYQVLRHLAFPDHHAYTQTDLEEIGNACNQFISEDPVIITTRKDAVKLLAPEFAVTVKQIPFFYVPIEVAFPGGQERFEEFVLKAVRG